MRRPGDALTSPVFLAALGLLIVNDHYLKTAHPSWLTGKLSDVAGLIVAPMALVAALEIVAYFLRRSPPGSGQTTLAAVLAIGAAFSVVQLVPAATDAYAQVAGDAARVVDRVLPFYRAGPGVGRVTADPTDLLALPALLVPIAITRHSIGISRRPNSGRRPWHRRSGGLQAA